jgi:hypothetical protein
MTARHLRVVAKSTMSDDPSPAPFFLIVADHDQGFFSVEGPMTNDRPWKDAAMNARNNQRRIECGPAGPDRDALAADYQRAHRLAGVPPASILRLRQ